MKKKLLSIIILLLVSLPLFFSNIGNVSAATYKLHYNSDTIYYGHASTQAFTRKFWVYDGTTPLDTRDGYNSFCLDPRETPPASGTIMSSVTNYDNTSHRYFAYFLFGGPGWAENKEKIKGLFKSNNIMNDTELASNDKLYAYSHALIALQYQSAGYQADKGLTSTQISGMNNMANQLKNYSSNGLVMNSAKFAHFHVYMANNGSKQNMLFWSYTEPKGYIKVTKKTSPTESNKSFTFKLYKCKTVNNNGKCTAGYETALYTTTITTDSSGEAVGYLGWEDNEGKLDLDQTYLVWESGEVAGKLTSGSDEYNVTYTNSVALTSPSDGKVYHYSQVKVDGTNRWQSTTYYYDTATITNTKNKAKITITKNTSPAESGKDFKIFLYNCGNDACTTQGSAVANKTITTNSSGVATATFENLDNGKTYLFWEDGDGLGGDLDKKYITTYSNQVTIEYNGVNYNYGKITTSGSATYSYSGTVTNTAKKGYIELTKTHSPSENTERVFILYKCQTDSCADSETLTKVATSTRSGSTNTYYLGGTSAATASLELDKTYLIWECNNTTYCSGETTAADLDDYVTTYSSDATTFARKGYVYGKIKLTRSSTNNANVKYSAGVTNTKQYGYLQVHKSTVSGTTITPSTDHFAYEIYKGNTLVDTICTNDSGVATYGLNNNKPTLEAGTTYKIKEVMDGSYAKVFTDFNCNQTNSSGPQVMPVYSSGDHEEVTIEHIGSDTTVSLNSVDVDNKEENQPEYGYIRVKKSVSGNFPGFGTYHFGFDICEVPAATSTGSCTTVYINSSGYRDFGKTYLEKDSVYTVTEHTENVNGELRAVLYNSSNQKINSTDSNYIPVIPVNYTASVTVGEGINIVNLSNTITDTPLYGYIELDKVLDGSPSFSTYHFGFDICKYENNTCTAVANSPFYTNNSGKIVYGLDNGNPQLELGSVYRISEKVDGDNHAIVYSDDSGSSTITYPVPLAPVYPSGQNYIEVTIDDNGETNLVHYVHFTNVDDTGPQYGYIEIQKLVSQDSEFDFDHYRFAFDVYNVDYNVANPLRVIATIYTDAQGYAYYGKDSNGNGTLPFSGYYLKEQTDTQGYAKIYEDINGTMTEITTGKPMLKPKYSGTHEYVKVTLNNLGPGDAGKNTADPVDNEAFGYLGVRKSTGDENFNFRSYHFRYQVRDAGGSSLGYACTDDDGLAVYGQDNTDNGSLELGTTYTFRELTRNGYARVYSDINCRSEITLSSGTPSLEPSVSSVPVTVLHVGSMTDGLNTQIYPNNTGTCLSIEKRDSNTSELINDEVQFELYTNSSCSGSTSIMNVTYDGIATFTGLTGTTYYAKEVSSIPGYTLPTNNCVQVTAAPQTSDITTDCPTTTINNDALYIGFYKTKEDGTPLTEATFKVKDSNGDYITVSNPVSGQYNGCYVYTGADSTGSELSVNDASTGLFCIAKVPSGTYSAEEQATGNDGYWIDNGTITGISTGTSIPTKATSNTVKNSPYVVTFYKTKETKSGAAMQGAKFKIKEQGTNNYIKVNLQSNVTGYEGCYIYTGTDTEANASELQSDSNGRICVIRVKGNTTYEAIETDSGDPAYSTSGSISVASSQSVESKTDNNTLVDGSYKLSFFKEKEDGTPLTGASFIIKKGNEYVTVNRVGSDSNYPDCYEYTGTTSTESSATVMSIDSNGRICVSKVPNANNYVAKETATGDSAYYIFENGEINLTVGSEVRGKEASNTLVNKPYVINFYKVLENGSTPVGGAEFVLTDSNGKYIEFEGTSTNNDYNGCYIYKGVSNTKTNLTKLTSSSENKSNGITIGEVCIVKIPQGTYKVTETKPVEYHTFGNDTTRNMTTTTGRQGMIDSNKFVNNKTEFEFTKTVSDEDNYDNIWKNISTQELKKIPFTIYDSSNNPVSVVRTSDGVYEYAGNTLDGVSGTPVTELHLNDNRNLYVYHLPKGTYTIKEVECCCEDTCDSPSTNTCYGFYAPKYSSNSGYNYTFTINDCSTINPTGTDENGNRVCITGVATESLNNTPTEVQFTKSDFYSYLNPNDTVKFENEEEISAFDGITFKVYYKDSNGVKHYVNFAKVGDIGTCKTEASYSEYRYIPDDTDSSLISGLTLTQELHTCGGHIHITHLCRGRKWYIEEVSVTGRSVFTLPENEEDRIKEIDLSCCQESSTEKPSSTVIINDKPTRIPFEKRDSKYGYLINDETTTFEVYRCSTGTTCHPGDYTTAAEREAAGMTLVKFNPRGVITDDEEDSGTEVYRIITNTDNASNAVTSLHPHQGRLVLRYLEAGYNYVLLETVSPKGYKLPTGRNAETAFTVSTRTVEVEEIDVPNKPTSLLIKKYDEAGNLLEGAEFKIYEGTTCDASIKPKDQEKNLLTLKTIRDGIYENREIKDTDTLLTCTDKPGDSCSNITSSLTLNSYVNTSVDFDRSVNQNNERVNIVSGEILVQYLDYGKCYIIEEVKAPRGYSLPENEDDRYTMVTITKNSDVVDTNKDLVNKPTPFTFYKFDEYNNLIDGGEFKLQKLNSNKKYEDLTVTEEELNGKLYYRVDKNSTNKLIRTINGEATVYYLEEGQYRIVETKAPEGMELPKKEVNAAVFYVDENGSVIGNSIITNKPKTERITVKPQATAELIVNISTGMERIKYGLIIGGIVVILGGLIIFRLKSNSKNKNKNTIDK